MEETSLKSFCVKRVYIQRDYSKGIKIKFDNQMPPDLEDSIPKADYTDFIDSLNKIYLEAEQLKFCEGCVACLTAYILYCCKETHKEKTMRLASDYIRQRNVEWRDKGVTVIDPIKSGFRVLEIQFIKS